ncbi:MAG TPA: HAMP domain-containing sensor histidine kinase [Oligoflexus sp.]|uniref:sensor histidine kinase n=1 Tax=Oligoflexus sp. TaxID=1971216 RepID=UPI002D2B0E87|nr:HAMP domain-containing sensor histidine kinase [Oligoflexus sp.]HYX31910.1 HAMP domain-containing sensor histidine kinase [Oligoflexus sp.]
MRFLTPIVALMDRFLSPNLRKMEARDLSRVRFLVFVILFAISCNILLGVLHLAWNQRDIHWTYQVLVNVVIAVGLLWHLRRADDYRLPAALCMIWVHGILLFALWTVPGLFSVTYLWSPCFIVISSLICGRKGSFLSALSLTVISVLTSLYHYHQGTPWVTISLDEYKGQILSHLTGSMLMMAIVTGVYEFMRDVSEKQLTRQRLLTARHLHTGAVGELVGHVAHEVNNPLAILQGSVTRLRRQVERNEWTHEARKLLSNMQRSHERIIRVQKSLSVFALGNQNEPFVSSDMRTILRDVQLAMKPQAQAQQVSLTFQDHSSGDPLRCQPHQLVYVLCCLIQNALDACRDHSSPSIMVSVRDDHKILTMTVTDNGKGIDHALQERIFQPFFTTKSGGIAQGLSLSVSRGILVEHGGEIQFSSRPGATSFTCQIPKDMMAADKLRKGA